MPTSPWKSISTIVDTMMNLDPTPSKVLDIGIGKGKYGMLCREYLTYWNSEQPRKVKIDGIEAFPDYVGDAQRALYDDIYFGNAKDLLCKFKDSEYDLVIIIDVIEHFTLEEGKKLLKECQRISSTVIVSTPSQFWPQGESWGNSYEKHLCLWTRSLLKQAGAVSVTKNENWIAVFAKPPYLERFTLKYKVWKFVDRFFPKVLRS